MLVLITSYFMKRSFNKFKMLIDIGANLTDGMYKGIYNGTQRHEPDLHCVLSRAWDTGIKHIVVTGGSLSESKEALELVKQDVGCHPTRCKEFEESGDPEKYLQDLEELVKSAGSKVSAYGEFGLDYDRLQFCDKETQIKYLKRQLEIASRCKLPLFLHCRNSASDLADILAEQNETFKEVVKQLPLERILFETDAPWCEVRPSHAGSKLIKSKAPAANKKEKWSANAMVKSRNEPCTILQILEIVSSCKGITAEELEKEVYQNTTSLFTNIV
ncbi:hypothetical protein B566_EDAN004032 [Ephemera danica]|nr:hypothetical protein B566_EDAN004032 [Ephemera danica]